MDFPFGIHSIVVKNTSRTLINLIKILQRIHITKGRDNSVSISYALILGVHYRYFVSNIKMGPPTLNMVGIFTSPALHPPYVRTLPYTLVVPLCSVVINLFQFFQALI